MSRYNNRTKATNKSEQYKKKFEQRDVKSIVQYRTPMLVFPTVEEKRSLTIETYTWKPFDRLYRIAQKEYDDHRLWWVIAQYNQISCETNIEPGTVLKIPHPLSLVLKYVR
tara:strand:+ start:4041 stop:4373 length:333 start_codon:yes stop_codon:yes gene_type:complete